MMAMDKSPEEIDVFCLEEPLELELKLKPLKLLKTTYLLFSSQANLVNAYYSQISLLPQVMHSM